MLWLPPQSGAAMARKKKTRSFHTKVVGVTFQNNDGSDRQDIIRQFCDPGDGVLMAAEPNNPHADHAVAIYVLKRGWFGRVKRHQIGYLSDNSGAAQEVFDHAMGGGDATAEISDVTGGTRDKPTLGVNIKFTLYGD